MSRPSEEMNEVPKSDFIREIIDADIAAGRTSLVVTRFPPEPNGYLHIGHAKSICLNFGIARDYRGRCHLRFDDTNPAKEDVEYADSIERDVRWLGFDWGGYLYHASDYFERMYDHATALIRKGLAYVCDLPPDEVAKHRGTLTEAGRPSPWRERSVEENLDLFARMKAGEFPDGSRTLRAKIDMAHPNFVMRDPVMYRILHAPHPHAGDKWRVYPMYDWAHGLEDSYEGVTHSVCTLEFEIHRPLYDWFLEALELHHPRQIEFARLNLTYTVMSKRRLLQLVEGNFVDGWDDPRMPTLSGLRRRGCPPSAIRAFCDRIGVAKRDSTVEVELLEHFVRDELNRTASRAMAVLRPLRVVITNYPEEKTEEFESALNPEDSSFGTRKLPFSREILIESEDFMEDAPPKFFRLAPGREVRLKEAYIIRCEEVVKDADGRIIELRCTHDPASRVGEAPDGRKIKGTIHWLSARHAIPAEVRLYEKLFVKENPSEFAEEGDFTDNLNPASLDILYESFVEPSLANAAPGSTWQFLRLGYFARDSRESPGLVFNRTVTLKDSWAKAAKKPSPPSPLSRGEG